MKRLGAAGADVSSLLAAGREGEAAAGVAELLRARLGLEVESVRFTLDAYSLNSVSGRVRLAGGLERFFKFHAEEGEREGVGEYYRARLLADAGLPVELPIAVVTEPGSQIAVYELRDEARMADVCLGLELADEHAAALDADLLAARRRLDELTGAVALESLAPAQASSAGSAIHQLFHHRLAGPGATFPGARYARFYAATAERAELAGLRVRLNGVEYRHSLAELAERAAERLHPERLAALPVLTAHGDDHHGNVWVMPPAPGRAASELRLFDPAFAAEDIPALLAPVKATFHNALAHPFWLYHPDEAARRGAIEWRVRDGVLELSSDTPPSPLRHQVLDSVGELVWKPLLAELERRGELPPDWREIVRLALFCCPSLVTDLLAAQRDPSVRMLGLAVAVAVGSEPATSSRPAARNAGPGAGAGMLVGALLESVAP